MVVADLHVHTTNSDGSLPLAAVPEAARTAGLSVVAVTDHDLLHSDLTEPIQVCEGVTVVHGVELRVSSPAGRVDLLGYGAHRTDALTDELDRLQRDRVERARAIVDCVEDRLSVALDVPLEPGVGRPHVARAVADSEADCGYQEAFDRLVGDDCPCYVPRELPSFERGRELLADACGLVALAHPLRYDDVEGALALAEFLDGIERYYPYGTSVDSRPVQRAIERYDLVATGGSDAHGEELGGSGLDRGAYRRFRARLSAARS